MVNPATSHCAIEKRWSPTQAIGRYDSTLSFAVRRSNCAPPRAAAMNAECVERTPLGRPVVPEV